MANFEFQTSLEPDMFQIDLSTQLTTLQVQTSISPQLKYYSLFGSAGRHFTPICVKGKSIILATNA